MRLFCRTEKKLAIERLLLDQQFFNDAVTHLYIYGILPEVIGKYYTRKPVDNPEGVVPVPRQSDDGESDDESKLWCYCNEPSFDDMVT